MRIRFIACFVVANIGGTLGVGIGASLLTFFEFFEFGLLQVIKLISRKVDTRQIRVPGATANNADTVI